MDELVFDELPYNPRHFVAIKLDDRICNFNFAHKLPLLFGKSMICLNSRWVYVKLSGGARGIYENLHEKRVKTAKNCLIISIMR